jgi:transcriptional regulator with PAS, ATPase and Fis domain
MKFGFNRKDTDTDKDIENMERLKKTKLSLLEIVKSTCEIADEVSCKLDKDETLFGRNVDIEIINSIQEPVLILDVSGYITYCNIKAEELLSLTKDELSKYHILKLLSEYSSDFERNIDFEKILTNYSENTVENKHITLDKHPSKIKHITLSSTLYKTTDGELWFVFIKDKSELIKKEQENTLIKNKVKIYEEVLESFTVSNNEMLVAVDKEWNVVYYNTSYKEKLKKIFNINIKVGENIKNYITSIKEMMNDNLYPIDNWKKCLLGKPCSDESTFKIKNNEYSFLNTFIPIYDENKSIIGAIQTMKELSPTISINVQKKQKEKISSEKI